ncbi:oligosaccharide flippase family protein [Streptomyces sp. NPDC005931]|uniref:oligosaccharide flippase family protein n=1 Tax=Streptomyces sp. NPDC005931 TaxID=3364737 RepID=UPI0036818250
MAETQVHQPAAVRTGVGPEPAETRAGSDSLFKNAYFLMLSTGVSAVLGLGFWLVAARYYSEEAVGQGSAAIAAMRLLASITATTMIGAVVRFVPRAGRDTGRLVWGVYAASSLVVALAAAVFLLTLDLWGASYAPLGAPLAGAMFVAACVAWALLTLQDGVLTGLRKAEWVPVGNAVFSVGKLALLAVFASALPVLGIFVSWAVAIAFSTLPLGWLIFRRLIPRQAGADRHLEPPRLRDMGRFLAGDSLGALFSLAMINLLPVMVAVRFSAAENGYFYVAYTVGGTMEFMAINMASSLTAHASHDPRQLADGVRGALRRMTLLLVPVVLVLVVFAPYILTPFSADYAEHGSTVLRLLALGALPRVVVELYIGVLRVQGRTGVLAVLQGTMCALVLGSAAALFTPAGIAGAGWAVLTSMTLVAAVCVFGLRAALRGGASGPVDLPPAAPAYGTRWARLNATAGYGTGWARRAAYEGRGPGADGEDGEDGEDTVTLFIGRPGYEREALQADTLALIVRSPRDAEPGGDRYEGLGDRGDRYEGLGDGDRGDRYEGLGDGDRGDRYERLGDGDRGDRRLGLALWATLGLATGVFWAAVGRLPWLRGAAGEVTGRRLLDGLPPVALVAGGALLLVFAASVTLCSRPAPRLTGTALASALLALYASPVALGWEPEPVDGTWYARTAGPLADVLGLGGPEPLLRWGPPVCQLLCLAALWPLLARADRWLPRPGRWWVLYLLAVAGWVWREDVAPAAPALLVALTVLALLAAVLTPLLPHRRAAPTPAPAPHGGGPVTAPPGPGPTGPLDAGPTGPTGPAPPNRGDRDGRTATGPTGAGRTGAGRTAAGPASDGRTGAGRAAEGRPSGGISAGRTSEGRVRDGRTNE